MWSPEPGWQRLPSGPGSATLGVWRVPAGDGDRVAKRLVRPARGDAPELSDPRHYAWWRREAEVALQPADWSRCGLLRPAGYGVDEDDDGITVWSAFVDATEVTGPYAARALGRFAAQDLPELPWWTQGLLAGRLRRAESAGGWPTLARTTVADLADALWSRRRALLERYSALPDAPAHGDATPGNLLAPLGDGDLVAIDWRMFGGAPAGTDAGYFALAAREEFDVIVDAWCAGHRDAGGAADADDVRFAARLVAVYTVLSQAEWALARVAHGEGALAAKYRHPAVAPYLRALQRQFPQIEALLAV